MMDWKSAISGSEMDTDYFLDSLLREIMSGRGRVEIISGIEKEYDGIMKPYKEALKQWEKNLKALSGLSGEELHKQYNAWIIRRLKSYDNILKENENARKNAGKLLDRISCVEVKDDFTDMLAHIRDKISSMTHKNEYILEKKKKLTGGNLEYDETPDWFRNSRLESINFKIRSLKTDIDAYEGIMKDKLRFVNKIFDELKL